MLNIHVDHKSITIKLTSNGFPLPPYKLCEHPHLGSHPLGFPTSQDQTPSKIVLYLHQGHSSILHCLIWSKLTSSTYFTPFHTQVSSIQLSYVCISWSLFTLSYFHWWSLFSMHACWLSQTWLCPHLFSPVHTWKCKIQLLWWSPFTLWWVLFIFLFFMGLLTHLFNS